MDESLTSMLQRFGVERSRRLFQDMVSRCPRGTPTSTRLVIILQNLEQLSSNPSASGTQVKTRITGPMHEIENLLQPSSASF